MTRPLKPKVARNAKASITPPNWARVPEPASTSRRSRPSRRPDRDRPGQKPAEHRPEHGGDRRQDGRGHEGLQVGALGGLHEIGEGRPAFGVLERAEHDQHGRPQQKQRDEDGERQQADVVIHRRTRDRCRLRARRHRRGRRRAAGWPAATRARSLDRLLPVLEQILLLLRQLLLGQEHGRALWPPAGSPRPPCRPCRPRPWRPGAPAGRSPAARCSGPHRNTGTPATAARPRGGGHPC